MHGRRIVRVIVIYHAFGIGSIILIHSIIIVLLDKYICILNISML